MVTGATRSGIWVRDALATLDEGGREILMLRLIQPGSCFGGRADPGCAERHVCGRR
jgi:hypothetical protein